MQVGHSLEGFDEGKGPFVRCQSPDEHDVSTFLDRRGDGDGRRDRHSRHDDIGEAITGQVPTHGLRYSDDPADAEAQAPSRDWPDDEAVDGGARVRQVVLEASKGAQVVDGRDRRDGASGCEHARRELANDIVEVEHVGLHRCCGLTEACQCRRVPDVE
jgi:hypothetical protein